MREGLQVAVDALLSVLDIERTDARRAQLDSLAVPELRRLLQSLRTQRAWPDS